jgi:predicted dehydrogenase
LIRLGIVGAGTLAQRGLLPHLTQSDVRDRVRVTAVCDPVEGRAARTAEQFGIAHGFTSYENLLGEVDAVTIASPIGLHYEQGRQALAAGKHVHFNKTMATTAAEATALIELARERNLRIVASPGEMLRPHNQELRRRIGAGEIGTLVWAICGAAFDRYHEDEPERRAGADTIDPSWYFRRPGGGPLYDMSVYALHALTGVLGQAQLVTALSGVRIREREFAGNLVPTDADDNTVMLLDFGEGLLAVVYGVAAGSLNPSFGARYFGTSGALEGEEGDPTLLPHVVGSHREIGEQHVFEDVMQLVDWVNDGKPSIVTAEHARHVIEIIEAAYRSAETGHVQELQTTLV